MLHTKIILREKWNIYVTLKNYVSKIGMLACASRSGNINFEEKCLNFLSDESITNGMKIFNRTNKCESETEYAYCYYNVLVNSI